jgi:hypothetical protein
VAVAALLYSVYVLDVMALSGRRTALAGAEAFTVYNDLISDISPIGDDGKGRLAWRGWLRALPAVRYRPGLAAFVIAMIGTVTYDGLSRVTWWRDLVGGRADDYWLGTLALVATVAAVGAGYYAASWVAVRIAADPTLTTRAVAASFAHTLVPIALAYAVAHYFTLILFEGQVLLFAASDPFGFGWDLFGTANDAVNFTWVSPRTIWYIQVAAIVGGHVIAVTLAHDRALQVFPRAAAVRTQYAMLGLMVGLTVLGLTLLAT